MHIRSSFALGAATVVLLAACSSTPAATTKPSTAAASQAAPTTATATATAAAATATAAAESTAPESTAPESTAPESTAPETQTPGSIAPSGWTVGVVTDVGTIDDKNFNQYSYEGAKLGAHNIGAPDPAYVVPASATEYAPDIQNFIDQGVNVIVTVGFNLNSAYDTQNAAIANPDVTFIGVDQTACLDEQGATDTTFVCAGDASTLLPNFVGIQYQEDQAGYLAGIVAASISKKNSIAAIGGINLVPAVVRYLQGFELGAKSVNDKIKVHTGYVSASDFTVAFNNPGEGKNYADQFLATNPSDVVFQVAGKTGNGVLESACAGGAYGIGVDVDQWLSLNAATDPVYNCIVTSAEKHLSASVSDTIQQIYLGTELDRGKNGALLFNAANNGVGISPEHDEKGLITPEIQALVDTALAGMADGTLVTCPETCGTAE